MTHWGYPTKNALKGWYQHCLKHQDLPASQAPRAPKYSLKQRQVAVAHYLAHDRCIAATMRVADAPGSELSLDNILQGMVHERQIGIHALELGVLFLQLPHLGQMRHGHP